MYTYMVSGRKFKSVRFWEGISRVRIREAREQVKIQSSADNSQPTPLA